MTRAQCQALLPIMQAFAEGKEVEVREAGKDLKWESAFNPVWKTPEWEYRIKPEPLEIEVWVKPGYEIRDPSVVSINDVPMEQIGYMRKKFREVTE